MKKRKMLLYIVIVVIVFNILSGVFRHLNSGEIISVVIPKGSSTIEISNILKDNHIISNRLGFIASAYLTGSAKNLQYGEYQLKKGDSVSNIIKTIKTMGAKKETVSITIPEGYSVEQIASILETNGLFSSDEFLNSLNDEYDNKFIKFIPDTNYNYKLQGYLYPSTYEFYTDATPHFVIATMLNEFEKQTDDINISKKDMYRYITIASMLQREALLDKEKPIISGVINNRLNNDMLLQIDATVVYAVTNGMYNVNKVYYNELKVDSLYNTYKNKGLPVGPICNPDKNSILAAVNPESNEYLYYRTDDKKNDGSHIFTKTYEEHLNVK